MRFFLTINRAALVLLMYNFVNALFVLTVACDFVFQIGPLTQAAFDTAVGDRQI